MKAFLRNRFPGAWRRARGCWHAFNRLLRGDAHGAREYLAQGFRRQPMLTPVELGYFQNLAAAARRVPAQLAVVDVGASDGFFTAALARFYTPKRAICYEPLPEGWPPPVTGHLRFPIEFRHAAVGAEPGTVELRRYATTGLASTLPLAADYQYVFDTTIREVVTRPVVTLAEDLAPLLPELRPLLLKLDTQGSELAVLTGAAELLTPDTVPVITLETMARTKYVGQARLAELIGFLEARGYQVYDIGRGYREPATGQHSEYDVTFCHTSYLG